MEEKRELEIGHIVTVRYVKAEDYPVAPKKKRGYPTLRELQRRRK